MSDSLTGARNLYFDNIHILDLLCFQLICSMGVSVEQKNTMELVKLADTVVPKLAPLVVIGFLVVFVSGVLIMNGSRDEQDKKRRLRVVSLMFVPVIICILILVGSGQLVTNAAQNEINQCLADDKSQVLIKGEVVAKPAPVLDALRSPGPMRYHNSHPLERFQVEIKSSKGIAIIELGRDSDERTEYWVYYPKYSVTSTNELGRIDTHVFDRY